MGAIFLDRIDASPILSDVFEPPFASWLAVLVNVLNENIQDIDGFFNLLTAQSYTTTEISTMFINNQLTNGVLLYDSVLNVYVGMQNGALVQFTTSSYP